MKLVWNGCIRDCMVLCLSSDFLPGISDRASCEPGHFATVILAPDPKFLLAFGAVAHSAFKRLYHVDVINYGNFNISRRFYIS